MSNFYVEVIGAETFRQAEQLLADVPGGMDRALKSATKRAVSFLRTQSTKEIRQRYDITRKNIRAEQNIRVNYRYFNGIEARVTFRGNKIPLWRYGGSSPSEPTVNSGKTIMAIVNGNLRPVHPGVAAAGHQLVSTSPTTLSRAFVAQMKSGHIGIFERTGGKTPTGDAEIRELMGSSVPQMLGGDEVKERLGEQAMSKFEERLMHEVDAIVKGWASV
jgi:hypothetical protein